MSQDSPDHDQNKHSDQEKRIIPIENLASAATGGSLFASAKAIHPRSTKGRYTNLRWLLVWITQIIFYGLPWLNWGERQAVLFCVEQMSHRAIDRVVVEGLLDVAELHARYEV